MDLGLAVDGRTGQRRSLDKASNCAVGQGEATRWFQLRVNGRSFAAERFSHAFQLLLAHRFVVLFKRFDNRLLLICGNLADFIYRISHFDFSRASPNRKHRYCNEDHSSKTDENNYLFHQLPAISKILVKEYTKTAHAVFWQFFPSLIVQQ